MPLPSLILYREAARLGAARQLRSEFEGGRLVRVMPGVYITSTAWSAMDADARYRTRIRAASLISRPDTQFSHDSAAAMWRLPSIGPWPSSIVETRPRTTGGTSRVRIARRDGPLDEQSTTIDGVLITSLNRTLADIAGSSSFIRSVAMLDHALRQPLGPLARVADRSSIASILEERAGRRGVARARRALSFANPLSQSPGESMARVQFEALGLPPPVLQKSFFDENGLVGIADFYWPHLGFALEFDGRSKYGPGRLFQQNVPPVDVLLAEKRRELRMRRQVTFFDRIDWAVAMDRRALSDLLRGCGLVAT